MKITKVDSRVLRLPFTYPLKPETQALATIVTIDTDDGISGHAMSVYAMPYAIRDFINFEVKPLIEGMDPMRIEQIRSEVLWNLSTKAFTGVFSNASSLLDIALWDIKGKFSNQPIWKMLGGCNEVLPVYITFGLGSYNIEELVTVAKTLLDMGQTRLKMVVAASSQPTMNEVMGRPTEDDINIDIERVGAVRDAIGDKVELMIDANKCATLPQALKLAKALEQFDLTWFEDPVVQSDSRLMAQLRKDCNIPIAAGSTGTNDLIHYREFIMNGSVDILQPNVRDIGGYTGGMKAAGMAQAFNIPLNMGGNWPHINMHLHAGVPNGGRIEFQWQGWKIIEQYFDGAPLPDNGQVVLPETPGLGFNPKNGVIDEYTYNYPN